jgi:hypothetical protein
MAGLLDLLPSLGAAGGSYFSGPLGGLIGGAAGGGLNSILGGDMSGAQMGAGILGGSMLGSGAQTYNQGNTALNNATSLSGNLSNNMQGYWNQTAPLRGQAIDNLTQALQGNFNPYTSPQFAPMKMAAQNEADTARKKAMSTVAPGGSLTDALTKIDLNKAQNMTAGAGSIYQDILNKAYTLAGQTPQQEAMMGGVANQGNQGIMNYLNGLRSTAPWQVGTAQNMGQNWPNPSGNNQNGVNGGMTSPNNLKSIYDYLFGGNNPFGGQAVNPTVLGNDIASSQGAGQFTPDMLNSMYGTGADAASPFSATGGAGLSNSVWGSGMPTTLSDFGGAGGASGIGGGAGMGELGLGGGSAGLGELGVGGMGTEAGAGLGAGAGAGMAAAAPWLAAIGWGMYQSGRQRDFFGGSNWTDTGMNPFDSYPNQSATNAYSGPEYAGWQGVEDYQSALQNSPMSNPNWLRQIWQNNYGSAAPTGPLKSAQSDYYVNNLLKIPEYAQERQRLDALEKMLVMRNAPQYGPKSYGGEGGG